MQGALGTGTGTDTDKAARGRGRRRWTRSTTQLDAYVPAAAVWILIAGKELWEGERNDPYRSSEEAGKIWCVWKERLEGISRRGDVWRETSEMAEEAWRRMEETYSQ